MPAAELRRAVRSPGGVLVALVLLVTIVGPWLTPYDPVGQADPASSKYRPPGTSLATVERTDGRVLLADRVERTAEGITVERLGRSETLAAEEVTNLSDGGVADRRWFLLGTDGFGRDLLTRILHGARTSLKVAILAVAIALTVGILIGALAGAGPRWLDTILMRGVDALLAFPRLFLILTLTVLFRPSDTLVILVLGFTYWMTVSRLVRAEVLSLKERDFVLAARGLGLHPARILFRHLIPNALNPVVVNATLAMGDVILAESALSFLGLGIQAPTPSWGNMVADGRGVLVTAWWVSLFPGIAIVLTVLAFNLLGDRLRDALDPRSRPRPRPGGGGMLRRLFAFGPPLASSERDDEPPRRPEDAPERHPSRPQDPEPLARGR